MSRALRLAAGVAGWVGLAVPLLLSACDGEGVPAGPPPTFADDVAGLLHRECAPCHHPEGPAPFSLLTYEEARPWADAIATVTRSGTMPPWLPAPGYVRMAGERRLTEAEIRRLVRWADEGAPPGDLERAPAPPEMPEGRWALDEPDVVLGLPTFEVPEGGGDVYRNFVVSPASSDTLWIRSVELLPGDPAVVHHARLMVDTTRSSAELDAADPLPGFDGMELVTAAENPRGSFVGWTPGRVAREGRPELAWPLPPGADLVVQLHLRPTDRPVAIEPRVGLHLTEPPAHHPPTLIVLDSDDIEIPPGEPRHVVEETFRLPVPVQALGVYPHAHFLARRMEAFAALPDGGRRWLLVIEAWDFHWQDEYRYAEPVALPAGSLLTLRYTYDNSAGNPRNPHRPPRWVRFGPESTDEMAELILQVMTRSEEERDVLEREVRWMYYAKESRRLARGEAQRGHLLAAAGEVEAALEAYRSALRRSSDPSVMAAMSRLLLEAGDVSGAVLVAEQALASVRAPDAAVLQALALAYAASGRSREAESLLLRAVEAAESEGRGALADSLRGRLADSGENHRNEELHEDEGR